MPGFYQWQQDDLILRVKVQPRASKDVGEVLGDCLKVRITTPPVDGKANKHLIAFLAQQFKVAKSQIELLSGTTGREKRILIKKPRQLPVMFSAENT